MQIETEQEQGDSNVFKKQGDIFCFDTLNAKQDKWNLFQMFSKKQVQSTIIDQIEKQKQANNQKNFYEKLYLNTCKVNIFALKKFIRNNIKSLREIKIKFCSFYLSDEDANELKNRQKNQRMFQELNFIWLIEQFKFKEIQTIKIKLSKDPIYDTKEQKQFKKNFKHIQSKIIPIKQSKSPKQISNIEEIGELKEDKLSVNEQIRKYKDLFKCEENSKFIQYQTKEKKEFKNEYTKEKLKQYAFDMIWGDLQDQERFMDKLYENILFDIKENLQFYQKYTKNALSDNKLIIIDDVLYNSQSLNQLYNLIQLNCKEINCIIFKDNGKIPPKVFSNLMKQILLIPKLKQISFLSSVLDQTNLYELQYLISKKNVQFLILYRSYFLSHEIVELLQDPKTKLQINHQRYVVLDISQKKAYKFTPYAFNLSELEQKKEEDMIEVEKLYKQQKNYPKEIYDQIVFFLGKNLLIVNKNGSEKILFKYWDLLNQTQENQRLEFQEKQDSLIQILEEQFIEDDINVLNYSLIKTLLELVIDEVTKKQFQNQLTNCKSYKFLIERFPIQVCKLIFFKKKSYLQTCYSYLYGFTSIKQIMIYINILEKITNHFILNLKGVKLVLLQKRCLLQNLKMRILLNKL